MSLGFWSLAFGLVALGLIAITKPAWLKAAGGLLIVATVIAILLQLLGVA